MSSIAPAPAATVDLVLASAAPPPALPAIVPPARPPRELVEKPLTPDGLTAMLAARKKRSDGWTPIKVAAFIEALAETCSVTKAAAYANMSPASAYHLRNHPEAQGFREAWDHAVAARYEELTDIAMDRVRHGVDKARWWKDEVVGHERVFSDRLLIHLLRRSDPDRLVVPAPVAPPPPAAVLPMAEDFMVAAAVDTGRLGWDPNADFDEADWPPEVIAGVARRRAKVAADIAEEQAFAEENMRKRRIVEAETAARLNAMRAGDAEHDRDMEDLSRLSKSNTYSSSRRRRRSG